MITSRHIVFASSFSIAITAQFLGSSNASAVTLISENFNSVAQSINKTGAIGSSFSVVNGNVDVIGTGGLFNFYPDNGNYIDLNGDTAGSIRSVDTFNFNAGDVVSLSFNYGANAGGAANPRFARVLLGTYLDDVFSDFNNNAVPGVFKSKSYNFTVATAGSAQLDFLSLSTIPTANGVIIDDVLLNVTSVPEPFTIVGTLVGGTAAIRMRKKLKSTAK
jgi:hypothetical protein